MRISILFVLAAFLSACATAPAPAPVADAPEIAGPSEEELARARAGAALAAFLRQAGSEEAPALESVNRAMGAADVVREEGAGAVLTYRLETCALVLLFSADELNVKRLADAHAGARHGGNAAPDLETCALEAVTRGAPGVS